MQEHSNDQRKILKTIDDKGLYSAIFYAKEGELVDYIIEVKSKLSKNGYNLTSFQNVDRGRQYMDRVWAVYKSSDDRPRLTKDCLFISNVFPNILDRYSKKCGAYKELNKLEKQLKRKGILK